MAEKAGLSELLTAEGFGRIARAFRGQFRLGLETAGVDGVALERFCSSDCRPRFCALVQADPQGDARCVAERRRAVGIASETGQSFITICHAGVVVVCVPVVDKESVHGGMFFGKCLWEPVTPILVRDVETRLRGLAIERKDIVTGLRALPVVRGRQIHEAAEFLFDLLYEVGGFDARAIRWRRQRSKQQSELGEFIQERKKLGAEWQYPLESERALLQKVKIGDRTGAKEILNAILGTILFKDIGDLGILKARLLELVSVLSRAAVEGGVSIDVMLERNLTYVNKVMAIDNQEDLCAWISAALNEFIELVYTSQDGRKMNQLRPAINYIDASYDKPVTLAEIARAAHLSASRLAHLFKEQMRITVFDYVTSVRIARAKLLLLATERSCTEICFEVGYNNQSYFTRTFKAAVGVTPRQFRLRNRRGNSPAEGT
ncbi:MAG: helix-turn-helix domain-containing protein [Sedimentisphaerales bacterium]|nr:helix-turn-helix domain-containing protein [Sedimentisphaerales bacterium]